MSKTPVSILQEYCARNVIVPHYDLVINGVGTHDPLFRYKLTVNGVITYGEGKSKKEAKHDAAREALSLLPINQTMNQFSVNTNKPDILNEVEDITSPYHGALKENAIGELITICANNKLPDPEFKKIGEEGPAHAKTFTFECHVAKLIEVAASRTKKQAKHLSAKLMIERLKTVLGDKLELSPPDPNEDSKERLAQDELDASARDAYVSIKSPKFLENFDLHISDYHKVDLTYLFGDDPAKLIQLLNYEGGCNPVNLLESLFNDSEYSFNLMELGQTRQNRFIYTCSVESSPQFMLHGIGNCKDEAEMEAAHNMLNFLKYFCSSFVK